jgi:hypothetical protein
MLNGFLILWGIAAIGFFVIFLDWLGRRKDRKSRDRAA